MCYHQSEKHMAIVTMVFARGRINLVKGNNKQSRLKFNLVSDGVVGSART